VSLSLKEVYNKLCPGCKKKIATLLQGKVSEQAVKDALEGKKEQKEEVQ